MVRLHHARTNIWSSITDSGCPRFFRDAHGDFTRTRKPIEFLEAVNGLLCSTGTTVEFVQCNVARDPAGADKILFFLAAYLPDAEKIILHTSVARLNGGVVSGDRMYGVGMNKQYK